MLSSVQGPLESFKEISKPGDLHRVFVKSDVKLKKNVFENLFYLCLVVICRLLIDPQYNLYLEGLACLLCTLAIAYYYHRSNRSLNTDRRAVCFVTSRPAKFIEVATLLSPIPVVYEDLSLRTLEKTNDLVIVAVDRVLAAFERTQCRTFLEETALYVKNNNYLNSFPGRHFKEVVELGMGKKEFARLFAQQDATFRTVFAYTEDGVTVHVFSNEVSGKIVNPSSTEWKDGDGSDPLFQPKGYQQTMSQLSEFKHFINARQFPCAEMRSVIEQKQWIGVYELHVTVANCSLIEYEQNAHQNPLLPTDEFIQLFRNTCTGLGVKALSISMDEPNKPHQLQTAIYVSCAAGYAEAQTRIYTLAQQLLQRGFVIERNRIEAMLHNQECPKSDQEALAAPSGYYFEFHARLGTMSENRFQLLKQWIPKHCQEHLGAHQQGKFHVVFSTVGGRERVFVNAKVWKLGSIQALAHWQSLLDALQVSGWSISKCVKPEYCIHDEKPDYDSIALR